MRLKPKPKVPKNPLIVHNLDIDDGTSLESVVAMLPDGIALCDAFIDKDWNYEDCEVLLRWKAHKYSPEEWERELAKYNKRLADYKEWYKENKEAVEEKLEKRRLAQVQKEKNRLKRLLREKEKLEQQIEKLKGP